jgi:hypothetical protein
MAGRTATAALKQVTNPVTMANTDASVLAHNECVYTVSGALTTDSITIYSAPCILYGIYVNAAISAHTTVIKDGATAVLSLPVSAAVGAMYTFPGIRFETSLVCDPDDATTTGNLTFVYKPL